ncbi:linear amide C-N hydrolase, partial [Bacillus thuringiensis]|nr:linear amide C-N hydrolase [Bacillus thuringiensis]
KIASDNISLIGVPVQILGLTPPIHVILAAKWGECIVLEPRIDGIKMDNKLIGVMTNSPDFNWHLQNLRQYNGLKTQQFAKSEW